MTVAYGCVFIAAILPGVLRSLAFAGAGASTIAIFLSAV
jgi:hypothetical protein